MNQLLNKNEIINLIKQNDKSVIFRKRETNDKSSPVWSYFTIVVINDVEQQYVRCDNCQDLLVYRTRDGTKSMLKHHRSCHGQTTPKNSSNDQVKVTEYFTSSNSSSIPKRITEKVKMACTEFVAVDCRPFELVDGKGFLKVAESIFDAGRGFSLTSNINIKDLIPSSITIGRHIDRLYEQEKNQLLKLCLKMDSYCIICDFWTERYTGLSYCGLVLRHITKDFKSLNFILGCFMYNADSQTSINIRQFVDAQLSLFGLTLNDCTFIVTDNENKMRAAFKTKCTRVGCAIHYLNKQIEHSFTSDTIDQKPVNCAIAQDVFEKTKRIVTHVRRSHRQIKLERKLQTYSDTRFNGAFYMLEVFFQVYDELPGVLNIHFMNDFISIDKDFLKELCVFLQLFDQVINELSEEEGPTIHKVIPLRQLLINHCTINHDDSAGLKEIKLFICERIKLAWVPQNEHFIGTLLHPSLKHFDASPGDKDKAINLVKNELLKHVPVVDDSSQTTTTTNTTKNQKNAAANGLLSRCFDQSRSNIKTTCLTVNELNEYMSLDVQISEKDDVFAFWKENSKSFPLLSSIVRKIFSIPAANTSVERLFSSSKNTVTDKRSSLSADKLNKLLFLQKNLFNLKKTKEETLLQQQQQKRKLSSSNDEQMLNNENIDNPMSTTISKRPKTSNDFDYSSDDMDDIIDIDIDIKV